MNPQSELIIRQQRLFDGRILLINPPVDGLISALSPCQCDVWTWNYADHLAFQRMGVSSNFSIDYPQDNVYQQIIIFTPKAKARLQYVLAMLSQYCAVGTAIYLVGEKKAGVEGSAKLLQGYGKTVKLDNARHCQLWQMFLAEQKPFKQSDWVQSYTLTCQDKTLTIYALAGVFSQQRLDDGTAQLLPYLSQVKSGKIADFGCGAGVIACYLALLQPQNQLTAYDVDVFALASTRLTAEANQLSVDVQPCSGIEQVADGFDAIVSNPPFHQGIKTDYDVSERLCREAGQHLLEHGELWIVANRFLNYTQWLQQHFSHCEVKADTHGFKVLYARAEMRKR